MFCEIHFVIFFLLLFFNHQNTACLLFIQSEEKNCKTHSVCVEGALQGSWEWIYEVRTASMGENETQHREWAPYSLQPALVQRDLRTKYLEYAATKTTNEGSCLVYFFIFLSFG